MSLSLFKVAINVVGLAGVLTGAYTTVKMWSKHSELGRKVAAELKR